MKKLIFPLSSLLFVFLMSACTVENTEQIVENAVAAQESLESYYAEVTSSFVFDDEKEMINYKEWIVKPDHRRTEMNDGRTYVSNGEMAWSYNKENHTVMVNDSLREVTNDIPDESDMIREMLTEMMDSNDVVANGKETVADRITFHLSLTPKESSNRNNYEIWIDEETYLPLKMVWEDESIRSETIYHHIEYNIDIDEDLFTFDIPDDAKVQSVDGYLPKTLTFEELEESTQFDLPDMASIPEKYQFKNAVQFGDVSSIQFKDDSGEYLEMSFIEDREHPLDAGENSEDVEVGRYKGSYSNTSNMQLLTWDTGQFKVELVTSEDELSKDELIEIAEGIR